MREKKDMNYYLIENSTGFVSEIRSIFENNGRLKFIIQKSAVRQNGKWTKPPIRFLDSEIEIFEVPVGYTLSPVD